MSRPSAGELETFIVTDHTGAPPEAVELFTSESSDGVPTAIVHHPEAGWFVIQTSGQGPYIIWPVEEKKA
jgi:hypothetical protein